ncbi:MAG: hypothetical protein APR54_12650 [Candidatus Cloacimonas sp. SDB]|nr:MAG: hypothetical protein APR54_12650 [Candidatus Cloacimonas sp. SDB]
MRISYRIIVTTVRVFMKIFYNYEIINADKLDNIANTIIAANHISANDPPFLGGIIQQEIFYLAKSELFRNKLFGSILKYFNCIPIRRGVVDRSALIKVKEVLLKGNSILIFPEGTRNSNKPKPGIGKIAIETATDVLPIFIKNSDDFKKCFLKKEKMKFIIGDIIDVTPFIKKGETKENYREFSAFVLKKINELENDS